MKEPAWIFRREMGAEVRHSPETGPEVALGLDEKEGALKVTLDYEGESPRRRIKTPAAPNRRQDCAAAYREPHSVQD